jgi:small ligand-binding sensory domain FIST
MADVKDGMKFAACISDAERAADAVDAVVEGLRGGVGAVDVAFAFYTSHHLEQLPGLLPKLRKELGATVLIGASAEGVIGGDREIERSPGLSLLGGNLPGVAIQPIRVGVDDWRGLLSDTDAFRARFGCTDATRAFIGMADPFSTPMNQLLQSLDMLAPRTPLIGGLASGGRSPGINLLACGDETFDNGFVGVSLAGALDVRTVVSQGARPVGNTMVITKAHDNVITHLGGKPALQALRDMFEQLSEREQSLMQHGLLVGRAISEYRESFGRGDFLVRNVMGIDEETGAISVTDYVRVGQTVQFQVRDAESASEDIRLLLEPAREVSPAGGLLFSCNGRGTNMFAEPDHDITVARQVLPAIPMAGFFAAGEIGAVGGRNFVHGHTASFALFAPKA